MRGGNGARRTVECCIHPANVDQQADHRHALRGFAVTKQLVAKDLTGLATPGHGINVEVSEALLADPARFVAVGKDFLLVREDGPQEVVLDVLPPERLAILFLEVPDLADGARSIGVVSSGALLATRLAF